MLLKSVKNYLSIGVHVISFIAFMYFSAHLTLIAHVIKIEAAITALKKKGGMKWHLHVLGWMKKRISCVVT